MQIKAIRHWQNWGDLALGVALFISPWALGYAMTEAADTTTMTGFTVAAWNAWLAGIVVGAIAVTALLREVEWGDRLTALIGAWAIVAPWILGFSNLTAAMASHVILGVLIVAVAAWTLWSTRQPTAGTHGR